MQLAEASGKGSREGGSSRGSASFSGINATRLGRREKSEMGMRMGLEMLMAVREARGQRGRCVAGGNAEVQWSLTFGAAPAKSHKTRNGTRQLGELVGMRWYANYRCQRRNVAATVTATAAATFQQRYRHKAVICCGFSNGTAGDAPSSSSSCSSSSCAGCWR